MMQAQYMQFQSPTEMRPSRGSDAGKRALEAVLFQSPTEMRPSRGYQQNDRIQVF